MTDTLFISDLHLAPERPQIMQLFIDFTRQIAASANSLYILGDFLEVWWGDDDPATAYQSVFDAIVELVDKHHTTVYLMHGNRDFMIGQALAERCHFELINDPCKMMIAGQKALLIHGDSLCTDDIAYQKFRQMVRNPLWQQQALSKTLEERYAMAHSIREQSKSSNALKAEEIMDVNEAATRQLFIDQNISLLIHGHTHRPAIHQLNINNKPVQRIVLGDWYKQGNYCRISPNKPAEIIAYPTDA